MSGMPRRLHSTLLVFGLSTAAGVYFATQLHLAYPASVRRPWGEALAINLAYYWMWGAAVPLIAALARRFPLGAGRWGRGLLVHAGSAALVTVLALGGGALALGALGVSGKALGAGAFGEALALNFHSSYPTYWLILFVLLVLDSQARLRERELRAAQLETRLAEARLDALRMQLNPHFLFNALNSISALMHEDVEAADAMMQKLGDLLRSSLDEGRGPEITLEAELELVGRYLDIERIRFDERLRVRLSVEPQTLAARVPAFALQPLVENAVRHAIAPRPEGGSLEISAWHDRGGLHLAVSDDGPGLGTGRPGEGVGLANTRARLEQLYGGAQALSIGVGERGGVRVELCLPLRFEAAAR